MKIFKILLLLCCLTSLKQTLKAQNVMINVITQNSGVVKKNGIIFFEVTINNTSSIKSIPAFKLKPQISFPNTLVEVQEKGHVLPSGWNVIVNKNGVITLTNGTDVIPENQSRSILIAIKGKTKGGPSTIIGNLTFSNGKSPGIENGSPLYGDNNADNSSSSSVKVE